MRYVKLLLIFSVVLVFTGCSIKKYYFPMSEMTNGKVYKYECKSDSSRTEYWKLTSNLNENTLVTEAFNSEYEQYEFFKEGLTKEGSKLLEFVSYRTEENGQKQNDVTNKPIELDVFKWKTGTPYLYSSESIEEYYGKVTFEKKREYIGNVKINVFGKEYKALKFKENYKTEVPKANQKYEYIQFSYYAKGLGLVKMEKEYSDGIKRILELTEIIPVSEWNKRQ